MLFNSHGFIFLYLPIVLIGFFQLGRINHTWAAGWLALSSIFFYGYWNLAYVGLLLGSIVCNYVFGMWIAKSRIDDRGLENQEPGTGGADQRAKKKLLIMALSANLILLGYYKYANFFLVNINNASGTHSL